MRGEEYRATVPGCAAAWVDTIELLGSRNISIAQALSPAIRSAEAGSVLPPPLPLLDASSDPKSRHSVPISEISSYYWNRGEKWFAGASDNGHELLVSDPVSGKSHAPQPGEVFKNPTLARTFRALVDEGKKGFYEGRVAEAIVEREFLSSSAPPPPLWPTRLKLWV